VAPASEAPTGSAPRPPRRHRWLAGLTLLLGCGITLVLMRGWWQVQDERLQARFDAEVSRLAHDIEHRFSQPVYGLQGLVGLLMADGLPSSEAFARAMRSHDLAREFPGLRGMGVIERIGRRQQGAYEAARRADGQPGYRIETEGDAADLYVVRCVEPAAANPGVLGLDVGRAPLQRAALQRAIDEGEASLSGALPLRQDRLQRPGFLLFVPAYRPGAATQTVAQRRAALLGLVYSPIVLEELLQPANPVIADSGLHLRLYAEAAPGQRGALLFQAGAEASRRPLSIDRTLHLPGGRLILQADSSPAFDALEDRHMVLLLGLAGLALSGLLSALVWLLGAGRDRAVRHARALGEEVHKLALVAERTANSVLMTDAQWRIRWVNQGFVRITGFSLEEAAGQHPDALLHQDQDDPAALRMLQHAVANGTACRVTLALRTRSGQRHWIDTELQPMRDGERSLSGFILIGLDVTEAREAHARLASIVDQVRLQQQEHERLLQAVQEACIYTLTDAEGRIVEVNDRFLKISGYSREEILGNTHHIVNSRLHDQAFWRRVWSTIGSGHIWQGEVCNRARDGQLFWLDTTIVPFAGVDGAPEKYVVIRNDITRLKTAQLALEEQQVRLANILRGTNAGTWAWNLQTGTLTLNERWAEICGYHLGELSALSIDTWMGWTHPEDMEALHEAFTAHMEGRTDFFGVELRVRHRDGHWVWVLDRGQLARPAGDARPEWMYGTRQDISLRKSAELALRQSEARAQLLSGLSAEWFWECDAEFRFTRFSGGAPQTLQSLNQRVLGKRRWELGGEPLAGRWADHRAALQRHERFKEFEYRIQRDDGEEAFWSVSGEPLFDDRKHFIGYIGIGSDISAAKRDQQKLARSEALLERTAQMAGVGSWRIDLHTRQVEWSRLAREIHRAPPDHPLRVEEVLDCYEDPNGLLVSTLSDLLKGRSGADTHWDVECRLRTHDGERIWVREVGEVEFIDGLPVALVGAVRDVTLRRTQEDGLRAKEARLRAIYQVLPLGIAITDPRGLMVDCNPAFRRFFGIPPGPQAARHLLPDRTLYNEDGRTMSPAHLPWNHALAESTPVRDAVLELRGGDHDRWFSIDAMPVAHHEFGVVVAFTDISLIKSQADALRLAKAQAEQTSRFKSQFLANMSHEIRTPINAVTGMLALLERSGLQARQLDYVHKAESASRSLLALINDILDFSKIEADKMVLDPQPFELEHLWRELSAILSVTAGGKDIELIYDLDLDLPRQLVGDMLRLRQVLLNLGSNAVKFTQQGEVRLCAHRVPPGADRAAPLSIRFEVCDTGIGIAPENHDRIFAGFTQAEASTTRRFGGTGLGLSISRRLIELMGGRLELHSEPGRGSCFAFTLPFERPAAGATPVAPAADPPGPAGRVLVVESNRGTRDRLCAMGRHLGWQVEAEDSGEAAMANALRADPTPSAIDLILLDVHLSGIDGWQTADRLRRLLSGAEAGDGRRRPVILMVHGGGPGLLEQQTPAVQALVDGALAKPITEDMLLETWRKATSVAPPAAPMPASQTTSRPLTGLRLLVVEDNAINQQVAEELLLSQGAWVDLADNGRAGLDAVLSAQGKGEGYDVVLMDMQMPLMDGLECTRAIRRALDHATLPIIAMTANAMAADRDACLEAGMDDHIGKPFELDGLVAKILQWSRRADAPTPARSDAPPPGQTDAVERPGAILDPAAALARLGGNEDLWTRMARQFLGQLPALLQGGRDGTAAERREALHALKGIAATVGAQRLSQCAAQAEQAARDGLPHDAEALAAAAGLTTQALQALVPGPASALSGPPGATPDPQTPAPLDGPVRQWLQDRMLPALAASDISAFDLLDELKQLDPGPAERWQALADHLDAMDFSAAATEVRERLAAPGA